MELEKCEKPLRIGDMVSHLDKQEFLLFGEIKAVDEGTPFYPFVVEFDDKSVKHFSLDGRGIDGRKITLIHRKK